MTTGPSRPENHNPFSAGIGDIYLDNVTQLQIGSNAQNYGNNAFIASRPNANGFIDGNLYVDGSKFVSEAKKILNSCVVKQAILITLQQFLMAPRFVTDSLGKFLC